MFVKNPLGAIALFITFIDGIAGLVISVNFGNLHAASERLPLIWFIVLFPVIVLVAFVVLVIKCPQNLFGPSDYDNSELYLKAIGKRIKPHEEPEPLKEAETILVRRYKNGNGMMAFSSAKAFEEIQEAALQRYADEHEMEIKTDVHIARDMVCDGVAEKNGKLYLFEVKMNNSPEKVEVTLRHLRRIYGTMVSKGCENLHVVLIFVLKDKLYSKALDYLQTNSKIVIPNLEIVSYSRNEIEKN